MIICRRPLAWFLFVALLFAQVANAAYACAHETSTITEGLVASTTAHRSAGVMAGCEEMNLAAPGHGLVSSPLCVDHCTHVTQATADAHAPVLHWLAAPLFGVLFVLPPIDRTLGTLAISEAPGIGRSTPPPISILLGRFLS